MGPLFLFSLASQQAKWLAVRQATVSGNIANANTPGFKARDVQPFSDIYDKTKLTVATTAPGHLGFDPTHIRTVNVKRADSWEIVHSGNSVSIEREMMRASEINRQHSLNLGLVKTFHRMLMASVRGGQ